MLPGFFKFIYELFLSSPQPPQTRPIFWNEIFPTVGLVNIALSLLFMAIFYYLINHILPIAFFKKAGHWAIFLFLNAALNFWFALQYCDGKEVEQNSYVWSFCTVNAIYAAIFYILFSFLFRRWSRGASTTPFKF
ncbi:hypothetical protein [Adhaeribacter aquaticus]|uniref:hypothetical protein n=1 Tax=Adhaeribacter aquaticus TaxID=299567 RepID=UPI00047B1361|nr:hypothetical protein [Adhaeribacter aquaticus]